VEAAQAVGLKKKSNRFLQKAKQGEAISTPDGI